jgi:hypothetical protein
MLHRKFATRYAQVRDGRLYVALRDERESTWLSMPAGTLADGVYEAPWLSESAKSGRVSGAQRVTRLDWRGALVDGYLVPWRPAPDVEPWTRMDKNGNREEVPGYKVVRVPGRKDPPIGDYAPAGCGVVLRHVCECAAWTESGYGLTRLWLGCIAFDGGLMVSTDGHRLRMRGAAPLAALAAKTAEKAARDKADSDARAAYVAELKSCGPTDPRPDEPAATPVPQPECYSADVIGALRCCATYAWREPGKRLAFRIASETEDDGVVLVEIAPYKGDSSYPKWLRVVPGYVATGLPPVRVRLDAIRAWAASFAQARILTVFVRDGVALCTYAWRLTGDDRECVMQCRLSADGEGVFGVNSRYLAEVSADATELWAFDTFSALVAVLPDGVDIVMPMRV